MDDWLEKEEVLRPPSYLCSGLAIRAIWYNQRCASKQNRKRKVLRHVFS